MVSSAGERIAPSSSFLVRLLLAAAVVACVLCTQLMQHETEAVSSVQSVPPPPRFPKYDPTRPGRVCPRRHATELNDVDNYTERLIDHHVSAGEFPLGIQREVRRLPRRRSTPRRAVVLHAASEADVDRLVAVGGGAALQNLSSRGEVDVVVLTSVAPPETDRSWWWKDAVERLALVFDRVIAVRSLRIYGTGAVTATTTSAAGPPGTSSFAPSLPSSSASSSSPSDVGSVDKVYLFFLTRYRQILFFDAAQFDVRDASGIEALLSRPSVSLGLEKNPRGDHFVLAAVAGSDPTAFLVLRPDREIFVDMVLEYRLDAAQYNGLHDRALFRNCFSRKVRGIGLPEGVVRRERGTL